MGSLLLALAILTEAGYMGYCMVSKTEQTRTRNIIRILAMAAFTFTILIGIIEFSFRWIPLLGLLLIQTIMGIVYFAGKKKNRQPYKLHRSILTFAGCSILFAAALFPAILFPQYEQTGVSGPSSVSTVSYTLTDTSRVESYADTDENRKVTIQFWYPETAAEKNMDTIGEKYPLVVFSHGAFGFRGSNYSTFAELASNGYVVCSIDHTYHSFFTKQTDGAVVTVDPSFLSDAAAVTNDEYDDETTYRMTKEWLALRTADINFVLDTILDHMADNSTESSEEGSADGSGTDNTDDVYKLIDKDRIGLFGHSLGGAAASALGRTRTDVDAVIVIDGTMFGEVIDYKDGREVLTSEPYPTHLLNIYNEEHYQEAMNIADTYANMVAGKNAADARQTVVYGAGHLNFTDLPMFSPFLAQLLGTGDVDVSYCITTMNSVILEYFDCYLKDEGAPDISGEYKE